MTAPIDDPRLITSSRRRAKTKKRPSLWRFTKFVLTLTACAAVAAAVAFPSLRQAAVAALPGSSPASAFGASHVRILLMGADRDYDVHGAALSRPGRSDTMMLADLDLAHNTAHLCSIPRDTEADIPGYGTRRINAAYALGGTGLAARAVQGVTGLTIDHTVAVDLDAFKDAVDAVGGVDVNVEKRLRYVDHWAHLDINLPAGRQHLNGEHAMQFVRFRHDALADIGRARRQQAFMHAFASALRRPQAIMSWPNVIHAVASHTQTDLTAAQMVALGRFARELKPGSVVTETLPGRFDGARWQPDPDAIHRMTASLNP